MTASQAILRTVGMALLLLTGSASANGRYPRAQQLLEDPVDPQRLWLRATYGLLTSGDRGKTWGFVCESAIGYSGDLDPGIGVFSDGRLVVALPDGLVGTTDGGCSFAHASELGGKAIADVSVERVDAARGVALESTHTGGGVFMTRVHRSLDGGKTWQPLGVTLPSEFRGLTLDVAPSDPDRIYVSGLVSDAGDAGETSTLGTVFSSSDAGASWTRHDVPGSTFDAPPYIAAVHPSDPDTLYVRVYGFADPTLPDFPEDALVVSSDSGDTFVEILKKPSRLLGFALSPDGATALAGYGNPYDTYKADSQTFGLYSAPASSHVFERLLEGHIGCLAWNGSGFYACTQQDDFGFELGVAPDPTQPFEGLLTTNQIAPLACPAGTPTGDGCGQAWSALCLRLELCGADAGADGGQVVTDGGTEAATAGGGCDCTARHEGKGQGVLMLTAFALLLARRRSR